MDFGKIIDRKHVDVFWGEMSACEHFVQIYDQQDAFMDTLESFVLGGLKIGSASVVIATVPHLRTLEDRLRHSGVNIEEARSENQYIPLIAEDTLARFMVNGWPDEKLFEEVVSDVLRRATGKGRKVRAFGEMVALLWHQGHHGAVVRLEHLWTTLCKNESFALFCAYPRAGFTENATASILNVCAAHSRVIGS